MKNLIKLKNNQLSTCGIIYCEEISPIISVKKI